MTELKINELSKLFGTSEKDLYKFCSNRALKEFNGHYKRLDELNRNEALLRAVKKIYAFDDKRSGWDRLVRLGFRLPSIRRPSCQ